MNVVDDPPTLALASNNGSNGFRNGDMKDGGEEHLKKEMETNKARYGYLSQNYQANPNSRLEVRKSHIHNWGLFTKSYFQKNEMIVEYVYVYAKM